MVRSKWISFICLPVCPEPGDAVRLRVQISTKTVNRKPTREDQHGQKQALKTVPHFLIGKKLSVRRLFQLKECVRSTCFCACDHRTHRISKFVPKFDFLILRHIYNVLWNCFAAGSQGWQPSYSRLWSKTAWIKTAGLCLVWTRDHFARALDRASRFIACCK